MGLNVETIVSFPHRLHTFQTEEAVIGAVIPGTASWIHWFLPRDTL